MQRILSGFIAVILLGAAFLATGGAENQEYEMGRSLYLNKCQICHGYHGDGNGPAGVSLTPKPRNFTNPRFWNDKTAETITETVTHGAPPMPAFSLRPEDIRALIYYMSHTFKKP
jgi:mono/diheme cytochrome c family protein